MNVGETMEYEVPTGGTSEVPASSAATCAQSGKRNLTLMMLVLTAGTGAVAIVARHNPQSAGAALAASAESTSKQILPAELSAIRPSGLTNGNEIVAKFGFAPVDVQIPLTDLKSDPFRMGPSTTQPLQLPDDAAESQRREQERQAALNGVQSLHLESIQREESRRNCTINGMLYQEGQDVDGFVVEEIATTTVVVRKGVYRFELRVR